MAYAVPVVTDATASSPEELCEGASHFLTHDPHTLTFTRTQGGVNNRVYYVDTPAPESKRYVMRVYNNGFNTPRVRYEHAVLEKLRGKAFTFKVPTLMRAKDGKFHATLASGAEACMFELIPGGPATIGTARSIGAATAELLAGMADVRVDLPLPNPLYRNIYEAHHKITRDLFFAEIKSAAFDAVREPTDYLVSQLLRCEALVERVVAMGLPEQQIHADLHFDNILATEDGVTGVLDFEFTAYDWRAMEMAVGLSKYVGMSSIDIPAAVESWAEGYAAAGGRLTAPEIELMPDFIILRILSNVVYFAGRAVAGEDGIEALTSRVGTYAARCKWLESKREWLVETLTRTVLAA